MHELICATVGEDFRTLEGIMEALGFVLEPLESSSKRYWQHPGRASSLKLKGETVGTLYEINPTVEKAFDMKTRVTVAELDFDKLVEKNAGQKVIYREIPKFPSVQLDISIQIPRKNLAETYTKAIAKSDHELIKDIRVIDEYEGEKIEKGTRSLTYSITYRSDKETLTEAQVNAVHQKVLEGLKMQGAIIRI